MAIDAPLAALTGATGFVGGHVIRALADAGWRVRVLLRREPPSDWRGIPLEIVAGDLGNAAALRRLVEGTQATIHLAGLIKAARREAFYAVNRDGARRVAEAVATAAPQSHLLLVSTMAAREPQLSDYAGSKRAGEAAVAEVLGDRHSVLRPPIVYGPGDRESLAFFQLARGRYAPRLGRPGARVAMIHGADLARLIVALAAGQPSARVVTAADAQPEGYRWEDIMTAAARAQGRTPPRVITLPVAVLRGIAAVGDVGKALGQPAMMNGQKLAEILHPDWSVPAAELARAPGWSPHFALSDGFGETVAWYRRHGWLP